SSAARARRRPHGAAWQKSSDVRHCATRGDRQVSQKPVKPSPIVPVKTRQTVAALSGIIAALSVWPIHAQSPQRQSPVDVTVPKPPTPVLTDGQRVLVYELHVTNLSAVTSVGARELT